MNNLTNSLSRACIAFVCCGMMIWSACSTPDEPKLDDGSVTSKYQDSINYAVLQSIFDTANFPSTMEAYSKYAVAIIPSLRDLNINWEQVVLSGGKEKQDSFLYIPCQKADWNPAMKSGLVIRKAYNGENYLSIYIKHSLVTNDVREDNITDVLHQNICSTKVTYKKDGSLHEGNLHRSTAIFTYFKDPQQQKQLLDVLGELVILPRDIPLDSFKRLQSQLPAVAKRFVLEAVPVDVNGDGEIDDEEFVSSLKLDISDNILWGNGGTALPNVTVINMPKPSTIPFSYNYGDLSDALHRYEIEDLAIRQYQLQQKYKKNPPNIPCGSKMNEDMKIAPTDAADTKFAGGMFGCTRSSNTKGIYAHFGWDIAGNEGDPFTTIMEGKVEQIYESESFGQVVLVTGSDHFGSPVTVMYAHMEKGSIQVKKGQQIKYGTVIGNVGRSGSVAKNVPNPHVHVQIGKDKDDFGTIQSKLGLSDIEYNKLSCDARMDMLRQKTETGLEKEDKKDLMFYDPADHFKQRFDDKGNCTNCKNCQ